MIDVRLLGVRDADILTRVAPDIFDDPIFEHSTEAFLADPRHRLVVAIEGHLVVGFVSAIVYVHPDKSTPEMWINEVGVAPSHRRQGIGTQLVRRMLDVARASSCSEVWLLTERSNVAAMSLYESLGGVESDSDTTMFTFPL
ncbi:MAG: GNAT family N-acetyltransferase [Acidimicrobiia bacterium]